MRDLFRPPEIRCPFCNQESVGWGDWLALGRVRLGLSRILSRLAGRLHKSRLCCRSCQRSFSHVHATERTVVGYHGCKRSFAVKLVSGRLNPDQWELSKKPWDWLGEGIYFWEHAPGRAWQWARQRHPDEPAVVAVESRLGRCLDFGDTNYTALLPRAYQSTMKLYQASGRDLPKNKDSPDLRKLDRLVIDTLTRAADLRKSVYYQTVRAPFEEGQIAFDGAKIRVQSHVQIAVRDRGCIRWPVQLVEREEG